MKFLLTSDWHLCDKTPICRKDDFHKTMLNKLREIVRLSNEEKAIVLCAGDVFDHWKVSCSLLSEVIDILYKCHVPVCVIPGQHDLPAHSKERLYESNLRLLDVVGAVHVFGVPGTPYVQVGDGWNIVFLGFGADYEPEEKFDGSLILLTHEFVYEVPDADWKKDVGSKAKSFMKKHSDCDLILCGDNHQQFVVDSGDQLLVNPGSLMRRTIAQVDHTPAVYLYDTEDQSLEEIFLDCPSSEEAISREHKEQIEMHEKRASVFVSRLEDDYEVGLSFQENVERFLKENEPGDSVEELVLESLEEEE